MSKLIRKSDNVSILLYHFVCPAKYRRVVFDEKVDQVLKEVCLEIAKRYQIYLGTLDKQSQISAMLSPAIARK